MNTSKLPLETAHKLASEARDEINKLTGGQLFKLDCGPATYDIILSAIEKAYCLGVDEMTKAGVEAVSESRAAHASEQDPDAAKMIEQLAEKDKLIKQLRNEIKNPRD